MTKPRILIAAALLSVVLAACATPDRFEAKLYTGEKKPSEISVIDGDEYVIVREIDGLLIQEKLEHRLRYHYALHRGYRYSVIPGHHTLQVFHVGPQFGGNVVRLSFNALPGHKYWIYAGLDCPRSGSWTPYVRDITNDGETPPKAFAMASDRGCPPADAL